LTKPFNDEDLLNVIRQCINDAADRMQKLTLEELYLEDEIRSELGFEEIVGRSEALRRVLEQVETVAPTDSTVLIYGETGTGKELIARAVHNLSARKSGGFVKLNCAAIPTGLLESEMFGHEKGAFTGAVAQRIGRFELANRGTMFLDEIGEIPLELQPELLRVLQEREFEHLGSARTLRTDARLVAATNRDLAALVKEQKFRSDLYYRLNVFLYATATNIIAYLPFLMLTGANGDFLYSLPIVMTAAPVSSRLVSMTFAPCFWPGMTFEVWTTKRPVNST
jgi:transcriptional regulator with GAF, ATPase, and Fis domain